MGSGGTGREQDGTLGAVQAGSPFPCPVLAPAPALTEGPSPESEEADGLASVKLVSTVEL